MTGVASAPPEARDRWRHALNEAAERLAVVRESIGVLGVMPGKGSLEGLAEDLSRASFTLAMIKTEVYGVINRAATVPGALEGNGKGERMNIVRTPDEILDVYSRAQKAAFEAEDHGDNNDHAEGVYATLQWLTGNTDSSPVDGYGEGE